MITDRSFSDGDLPLLTSSLEADEFHQSTNPEFFTQPGTVCNVYEDESGPVCFVRGSKALRLDVHFVANGESERNATALLEGVSQLAQKARENGFLEIIVNTTSPELAAFAVEKFGFAASDGELTKRL